MQTIKRIIVINFLLFSFVIGASNVLNEGVDIVVIKKDKEQSVYSIHFDSEYSNKFKNMGYRSANIYIKEILIQAYKNLKLNTSELGKFNIFIGKKQLELFKSTGILLISLQYKARAYTQIIMKVSVNVGKNTLL